MSRGACPRFLARLPPAQRAPHQAGLGPRNAVCEGVRAFARVCRQCSRFPPRLKGAGHAGGRSLLGSCRIAVCGAGDRAAADNIAGLNLKKGVYLTYVRREGNQSDGNRRLGLFRLRAKGPWADPTLAQRAIHYLAHRARQRSDPAFRGSSIRFPWRRPDVLRLVPGRRLFDRAAGRHHGKQNQILALDLRPRSEARANHAGEFCHLKNENNLGRDAWLAIEEGPGEQMEFTRGESSRWIRKPILPFSADDRVTLQMSHWRHPGDGGK